MAHGMKSGKKSSKAAGAMKALSKPGKIKPAGVKSLFGAKVMGGGR